MPKVKEEPNWERSSSDRSRSGKEERWEGSGWEGWGSNSWSSSTWSKEKTPSRESWKDKSPAQGPEKPKCGSQKEKQRLKKLQAHQGQKTGEDLQVQRLAAMGESRYRRLLSRLHKEPKKTEEQKQGEQRQQEWEAWWHLQAQQWEAQWQADWAQWQGEGGGSSSASGWQQPLVMATGQVGLLQK